MASDPDTAITLVIPCYNEADRIDLSAFRACLDADPSISMIFVDDGSTDDTRRRLESLANDYTGRVVVIAQADNRGKGEAVRAGLIHARTGGARIVGFWDADLATPLDAVHEILGVLERRPDTEWVFGSRVRLLGREIERRAVRHYVGRVFATAAALVLDIPVYDTQCGAKLFRGTTELDAILAQPFVSRWVFDVEMIARLSCARRDGGGPPAESVIYEQPLSRWSDVGKSKVHALDLPRAFVDLARIWRSMRRRTLRNDGVT